MKDIEALKEHNPVAYQLYRDMVEIGEKMAEMQKRLEERIKLVEGDNAK